MGTVTPDELLRLYTLELITVEQAVGHIVQNLAQIKKSLETLRGDVNRLKVFTGMEEGVQTTV